MRSKEKAVSHFPGRSYIKRKARGSSLQLYVNDQLSREVESIWPLLESNSAKEYRPDYSRVISVTRTRVSGGTENHRILSVV